MHVIGRNKACLTQAGNLKSEYMNVLGLLLRQMVDHNDEKSLFGADSIMLFFKKDTIYLAGVW